MKCLVAIIGPTATGKTKLAINLAKRFNGEIINADSRQVYRFMNIGTAKPSPAEQTEVVHHLIDIVNPDESFSLSLYKDMAVKEINGIQKEEKFLFLSEVAAFISGLWWRGGQYQRFPRTLNSENDRKSMQLRKELGFSLRN